MRFDTRLRYGVPPVVIPTLDAGKHRSRTGVDRLQHPVEAERILDVLLVGEVDRGALPVHVRASAEAFAVSRKHDGAGVPDVGEGLGQLADQCGVECVPTLRPSKGDPKQRSLPLDSQRAHQFAA